MTALAFRSRFATSLDTVSAVALCGGVTVELNASHARRCPRNDLVLDFEAGTVHVPRAFAERPFTELHLETGSGFRTERFEPGNPYGQEVIDFVDLLAGRPSIGTTLDDAIRNLRFLEAITESYTTGNTVTIAD